MSTQPAPEPTPNLLHVQFKNPEYLSYLSHLQSTGQFTDPSSSSTSKPDPSHPLTESNVMSYFATSPFFDRRSNNEQIRMQNIANGLAGIMSARQEEQELKRFTGLEFVLVHARAPLCFVVQKRWRSSPTEGKLYATERRRWKGESAGVFLLTEGFVPQRRRWQRTTSSTTRSIKLRICTLCSRHGCNLQYTVSNLPSQPNVAPDPPSTPVAAIMVDLSFPILYPPPPPAPTLTAPTAIRIPSPQPHRTSTMSTPMTRSRTRTWISNTSLLNQLLQYLSPRGRDSTDSPQPQNHNHMYLLPPSPTTIYPCPIALSSPPLPTTPELIRNTPMRLCVFRSCGVYSFVFGEARKKTRTKEREKRK